MRVAVAVPAAVVVLVVADAVDAEVVRCNRRFLCADEWQ